MATQAYKVTGARSVEGHAPGSEFEHEFTVEEERDLLGRGWIEIVPRPYKVLVGRINDTPEGEIFFAALPIELEGALLGTAIERAPRTEDRKKQAKRELTAKEA